MSIPDGATLLRISGTSASVERFAFGIWCNDPDGDTAADFDISTPFSTFRSELTSRMNSDQVITDYDVYQYAGGVVVRHDHESVTHAGSDTSGQLPLQVATVMTLRTATLTRRGRGRVYLPTAGFSMMSGGGHLFNSTPVGNLVTKLAAWGDAFATAGKPWVVVSRVGSVMHEVTSIDADLVPDTQRRRSNKLVSTRQSASVG